MIELQHLTNDELFRRYESELALHYRSPKALQEALRVLALFHEACGSHGSWIDWLLSVGCRR